MSVDLPETETSFHPGRKWAIGMRVALSVLLLVLIVAMANYLGARHFTRIDLSASSRNHLSPLTHRVISLVSEPVRVIVFYDRTEPLYGMVSELLQQYQLRSPWIQVEHVDHVLYKGMAQEIQAKYKLAPGGGDRIIFESRGDVRVVYARDLSEYDMEGMFRGEEVRRTGFKGEQMFTSALYSLLDGQPGRVYFLQGHREHDPFNPDDEHGYSRFQGLLEESNITSHKLEAIHQHGVPEDCQLLIIAGPYDPFSPGELDELEKYLNAGGRLLALFNYLATERNIGLEIFLARWGIDVGQNFVLDEAHGRLGQTQEILAADFGSHAIVAPLHRSRLSLAMPRSVGALESTHKSADGPRVTELIFTSEKGVVISRAGSTKDRVVKHGSIPLAVAVEQGAIQGLSATRGATRIVVVGESFFLGNSLLHRQGNQDFGRNVVNWLLDRDTFIEGIGPKSIDEYQITITEAQMAWLRWFFLGIAPGSVLVAGGIVWLRRRT
jgi:hypothetical protein